MDIQRAVVNDTCQMAEPCKVISISDFNGKREEQLKEWLEEQMYQRYEDRSRIVLRNPMLRITTKFEALSHEAQWKLYGYAEAAMENAKRPVTLRDRFWSLLEKGSTEDGSWKGIEDYANELLTQERPWER